jgi:predicted nicotinamide N-methyase
MGQRLGKNSPSRYNPVLLLANTNMTPLAQQLERELQRTLPTATLTAQSLPELDNLSLYLLNPDYPRTPMSSDEMQVIWQEPAYWIFCWASGLAMAKWLGQHPESVRG